MHLALVDCYDSFTHNLAQAFEVLGAEVEVVRCDQTSPAALAGADRVVLGPGPGRPAEAGCVPAVIAELAGRVPILGVCLGHQAIGEAFGGQVVRHTAVHGHASPIHHDGTGLFAGVPAETPMTRYHSLVLEPRTLPACLRVTAWSEDGAIMGIAHRHLPVDGVQFHPESVLSGGPGLTLLANFLDPAAARRLRPAAGGRHARAG